jgi:2,3-bisphosphoglycerate-dependent phosphoglycerate mutase
MYTHIFLVRHAHSVYTPDELGRPLSERGIQDALEVTQALKNENIDVVVSSPYKRAVQTVEGTAKQFDVPINLVEDFRERVLCAKPVENFEHAVTKVWEDFTFAWEGGESNIQAQKRGANALYQVVKVYEGKNVVIGTHGNLMALTMNHFDTAFDFGFWRKLDMPDIYKLSFYGINLKEVSRVWKR